MKKTILAKNQDVKDIIAAMVLIFKTDFSQYQNIPAKLNILHLPLKKAGEQICDFLKTKCRYNIEPEHEQRIMTAEAILNLCGGGIDCKNYAMFSASTLAQLALQTGQKTEIFFRLADYTGEGYEHVFTVFKVGGKTYWLDPVLKKFDEREPTPYFYRDYKIFSNMLVKIGMVPVDPSLIADATEAFGQLLTKEGVKPGLFAKYGFLSILDNSTGKWKSRSAFLNPLTPNERIAFYIEAMKAGEPCDRTVLQYPELFYHKQMPNKGTPSDVGQVSRNLIEAYNALVREKYLKGQPQLQCGKNIYPADYVLLPGGSGWQGAGFSDTLQNILNPNQQGSQPGQNQAGFNMGGTGLLLVAAAIGAYFFIKK
jgi:hypothetical protein